MLTAILLGLVGFAAGFAARDIISRRRRAHARRELAMGAHRYPPYDGRLPPSIHRP